MEIIFELLGELLFETLFTAVLSVFDARLPGTRNIQLFRWLGFLVLGGILGGLSVLVFPAHFIRREELRLAWLIAAPLVGGVSMLCFEAFWRRREPAPWNAWHFAHGATLTGVIALCRFLAIR